MYCSHLLNLYYFLLKIEKLLQTPFIRDLRKILVNIRTEEIKLAILEEKNNIKNLLNTILNRVQFCCTDTGIDVVASIVSLDEDFIKVT